MRRILDTPSEVWLRRIALDVDRLPSARPYDTTDVWFAAFEAAAASEQRARVDADVRMVGGHPDTSDLRLRAAQLHAEYAAWLLTVSAAEDQPDPLTTATGAITNALAEASGLNDREAISADAIGWIVGLDSEISLRMRSPARALESAARWVELNETASFDPATRAHARVWLAAVHYAGSAFADAARCADSVDADVATAAVNVSAAGVIIASNGLADGVRLASIIDRLETAVARADGEADSDLIEVNRNLAACSVDVLRNEHLTDDQRLRADAVRSTALAQAARARAQEVALAGDTDAPTRAPISPTAGSGGADLFAYKVGFATVPLPWRSRTR